MRDPAGMDDEVRARLVDELTPGQILELLVTVSLASAFSRAAITWGPPVDMPPLEVPTPAPDATGGS